MKRPLVKSPGIRALVIAILAVPQLAQRAVEAVSESPDPDGDKLIELSLEELMDIDVTVVSRSGGSLSETPAAVYVITGDELRRSGHSSIPEALRMVPGFYVSRWKTDAWDVTSRGFGTGLSSTSLAFLNQLLVMVDGVVVYTPLFAGVWWPLQDFDLADVERIEVVRGPGGILWGSNAVHGVVHIITKKAADTQGLRMTYRNARDERHGSIRSGGVIDDNASYRVWVKRADYDTLHNPFLQIDTNWYLNSAGFRADIATESGKNVTFWGRTYEGVFEDTGFDLVTFVPYQEQFPKKGFQVFGSIADPESNSAVQAWFSNDTQNIVTLANIKIDTFDIEAHRGFELGENNTLSVGAGYRLIHSRLFGDDPFFLDFDPRGFSQNNFRVFATDAWRIPDLDLEVLLGLQVEHNEYTDFEVQPTLRLTWTPRDELMFWAGVTRAVRVPSLEERTQSSTSFVVGNEDFESEELVSVEVGGRKAFGSKAMLDLALFWNDFDKAALEEPLPGGQFFLTNGAEGRAAGGELAFDLWPTSAWKVRGSYSLLVDEFEVSADGSELATGDYSPKHLYNLRSYYDINERWEFDTGLYAVRGLRGDYSAAEYVRLDARLGYRPCESLEFSFGVQHANDPVHSELDRFDNVRRSIYVSLSFEPQP